MKALYFSFKEFAELTPSDIKKHQDMKDLKKWAAGEGIPPDFLIIG